VLASSLSSGVKIRARKCSDKKKSSYLTKENASAKEHPRFHPQIEKKNRIAIKKIE
jgi:hypothetical protein